VPTAGDGLTEGNESVHLALFSPTNNLVRR
jgi:hypothetical protein